jgi:hypothetical protein
MIQRQKLLKNNVCNLAYAKAGKNISPEAKLNQQLFNSGKGRNTNGQGYDIPQQYDPAERRFGA